MEDMFQADKSTGADIALALGNLLREHKGGDVAVLDLRELNGWTDFFVIATVTSGAHQQGLERHVKEFSRERGVEIQRRSRKPGAGVSAVDEWCLIDMGSIVIHLMTSQARSFYELERLWSAAPRIDIPEKIPAHEGPRKTPEPGV
ncbi:MAG: ribosome silencing factor [Treponema sp.]|jgi:ribosome-associated protein|nr:ribosome silencing factor [Treponema sp.]